MTTPLEKVLKKADTLKALILMNQDRVNNWDTDTVTITELKVMCRDLETQRQETISLYKDACGVSTPDEITKNQPTFHTLFNAVSKIQVDAGELLTAKENAAKAKISPSFKLERIKLPQFGGNLSEWQSFHDLFVSSVDKNPTLSGAEKMIHLKSSLVDDAAAIVSSFQATDSSYKSAWDMVVKRYSNQREIIFAHIRKLDDLKASQDESGLGLRSVADTINECVRSLKNLKVPVEHWDIIIVFMGLKKLSPETRKQRNLAEKSVLPNVPKFIEFLETRARALADSESSSKVKSGNKSNKKSSSHVASSASCPSPQCSEGHRLNKFKIFLGLSVAERRDLVSKKQLCYNCLFANHSVAKCKMEFSCSKCGKRHHTLLHVDSVAPKNPVSSVVSINGGDDSVISEESSSISSTHCTPQASGNHVVLMGTLIVNVMDSSGVLQSCRAFVDPGSESNFISEHCVDRLGLKRKRTCVTISGISGAAGETSTGIVTTTLGSRTSNYKLPLNALILRKITNDLPRARCKFEWPHLKGLELGDPSFNTPGQVDILIGASDAAAIMLPAIKIGPVGAPSAQKTQFGWMLSGCVNQVNRNSFYSQIISHHANCDVNGPCLEKTMSKFWELEEPDIQQPVVSEEDEDCELHFKTSHVRDSDGSYTVELPFKSRNPGLGHSREAALQRFLRVERRLSNQPEIKDEYVKCMRESLAANFMEPVPLEQISKTYEESYYMPHREVVKDSSTSTRVRIVFDASAKSSNKNSLNDILMTGPKLQVDLVPLLIRFRSYPVAMSADIVKFYPQFKVSKKHVDFQRLLWREDSTSPIQDFRMLRVTFGVTSAPFLAIRCLQQLAEDEQHHFPKAASILKEDFLVDNLLSGADDVQSALLLQKEILEVMKRGNLNLRKWSSNHEDIVNAVPQDQREMEFPLSIKEDEALKTIGILWNPVLDNFGVSINIPSLAPPLTKRKVLSSIAKTFDPLGWLSPVTVTPKILMQSLWKEKLDWDAELPVKFGKIWMNYCQDLILLKTFRIKRCLVGSAFNYPNPVYELHGFSDASLLAYAACVYVKTVSSKGTFVNLIMAKTKVCPLKTETIPRLELCAAALLSKLIKTVQNSLRLEFKSIHCWTDSTIVLDWIKSNKKLPVFVANRVRAITSIVSSPNWSHVDGSENPADAPSRGISSAKLLDSLLWQSGPSFLSTNSTTIYMEDAISNPAHTSESPLLALVNKTSSYSRLIRTIAFVKRFVQNCQHPGSKLSGPLTSVELNEALYAAVSVVQEETLSDDIHRLKTTLPIKSGVKFMAPFLDDKGLLRVGGRLSNSTLSYDQRHPFLLPKSHIFTEAMVRYYHITHAHAGPQLLLSLIRNQFWIIRGPDVCKRVVRKCIICFQQNPATTNQLMGQLPTPRVTLSKPFSNTGMDYAGPFSVSTVKGRNPKIVKHYVSIFVCMATRAVHLELVGDLTTPSFVNALSRFIARRGLPSHLYCDGGKNFVGAKNEMVSFINFMKSPGHQDALGDFYSSKSIQYHFNPPLSPHHGGLWEAGVKSMKFHLKRVTGDRNLTIEEFSTLLCQVEAILNSRPLTQLSSDPNDFAVLTPGHFLVGESLLALPQHNIMGIQANRLSRWQTVQQMHQHFWRRWNKEYLNTLQSRPKWYTNQPNLDVGIMVLIRDDEPTWGPLKWKLGRIVSTFPGPDGRVRVCEVKTASGRIYKRSIANLSPLPIYN